MARVGQSVGILVLKRLLAQRDGDTVLGVIQVCGNQDTAARVLRLPMVHPRFA